MTNDSATPRIGGILAPIIAITSTKGSSTVILTRYDQKEALLSLKNPLIPPGSPLGKIIYSPTLNLVLLETINGETIAAELPSMGSPPPFRSRPVVYLDQKDWSSLAKFKYDPDRVQPPAERSAAEKIIALVSDHMIILPMSAGHMSETCKWTNGAERYKLALTVLQLSQGWQMRDPLAIRRHELRKSLLSDHQGQSYRPRTSLRLRQMQFTSADNMNCLRPLRLASMNRSKF